MENLKELKRLTEFDVVRIARERGFIAGEVIMDSQGLIKLCKVLGVNIEDIKRFLFL